MVKEQSYLFLRRIEESVHGLRTTSRSYPSRRRTPRNCTKHTASAYYPVCAERSSSRAA